MAQFVLKGCEVKFAKKYYVDLRSASGEVIFSGRDHNHLYYVDAQVVSSPLTETRANNRSHEVVGQGAHSVAQQAKNVTLFGLPVGRISDSTGRDFPRRLLETHWALGHMHMDKVRRLFNLKKGENPHCAPCTVANARKQPLAETRPRATRPFYRIHMDIFFTKGGGPFPALP